MSESRRRFLKEAGCGLSAAALLASVERFGLINALAQQQPNVASDYKALVCIFLLGGNDGNNMVVPYDNYSAPGGYDSVRTGPKLAIPKSALLKITPSNTGGVSYGLHPNLSPEANNATQFKGLLDVWNQGKLAALCNVGPLVQPITRAQYLANIGHPYQLFSHSDQQTVQQTSVANTVGQTGWGGRISDVTGALNGVTPLPMNISVAGTALFATGGQSRQLSITPYASLNTALQLNMEGGSSADQNARRAAFQQLLGFDLESVPTKGASDTTNQALVASAALSTNPTLSVIFPNTYLGNQLQQVARLVKVRDSIGMKRQIFFCALGGFDSHTNQTGTVPTSTSSAGSGGSGGQGSLLAQLSQAMRAFYDEMGAQGMSDRVTTFTLSDFGRTLAPSGPSDAAVIGSDHAWGNHSLIMGGSVAGQTFHGTYPVLQLSGPDDADSRGRWIPTTSVEQYGATLAAWYGVAPADIPTVFPFLYRFSPTNLGFLS